MNEVAAIVAHLVGDLHWQIDQLPRRGVKNAAGNPYNPSYFKRGLQNAINRGDVAVPDYIRTFLRKPPTDGFKKLEEADSLDLACEALVADANKPYAGLFSDDDRELARRRLRPYQESIARHKAARSERVAARRSELPADVTELRTLAQCASTPEDAIAINGRILEQAAGDTAAMTRLGRAYEEVGALDEAATRFEAVLAIDPKHSVASKRLAGLVARRRERKP